MSCSITCTARSEVAVLPLTICGYLCFGVRIHYYYTHVIKIGFLDDDHDVEKLHYASDVVMKTALGKCD
jgi:hypothetical protein